MSFWSKNSSLPRSYRLAILRSFVSWVKTIFAFDFNLITKISNSRFEEFNEIGIHLKSLQIRNNNYWDVTHKTASINLNYSKHFLHWIINKRSQHLFTTRDHQFLFHFSLCVHPTRWNISTFDFSRCDFDDSLPRVIVMAFDIGERVESANWCNFTSLS